MKNEDTLTTRVEMATRHIPSISFLGMAVGAMAASALLMVSGHKRWAQFVGQWAPTLLIIGTYNKIAKTFSAPYDEEQRVHHGGNASPMKVTPEDIAGRMVPQPLS
jgi:hypothetical protein